VPGVLLLPIRFVDVFVIAAPCRRRMSGRWYQRCTESHTPGFRGAGKRSTARIEGPTAGACCKRRRQLQDGTGQVDVHYSHALSDAPDGLDGCGVVGGASLCGCKHMRGVFVLAAALVVLVWQCQICGSGQLGTSPAAVNLGNCRRME